MLKEETDKGGLFILQGQVEVCYHRQLWHQQKLCIDINIVGFQKAGSLHIYDNMKLTYITVTIVEYHIHEIKNGNEIDTVTESTPVGMVCL